MRQRRCLTERTGIPAFYTPTGVSTLVQTGGIPIRYGPPDDKGKRTVAIPGNVRETKEFNGRTYNMETAIKGESRSNAKGMS